MAFLKSSSQSRFVPSLLFAVVSRSSLAQLVHVPTELGTNAPTLSTTAFASTSTPSPSMTTIFTTSLSQHTATSSSTTSRPTRDAESPLIPVGQSGDIPSGLETEKKEGVFNYYFLILASFAVLVAIFLWWIRLRRKRRKEQLRLSGQHALARDLDGWVTTRRWMHGTWIPGQTTAFSRREEGLNEHGEAPPPYEPKSNVVAVAQGPTTPGQDPASGLSIPLRTLSRDRIEMAHPPQYEETDDRQGPLTIPLEIAPAASSYRESAFPPFPRSQLLRNTESQPNA